METTIQSPLLNNAEAMAFFRIKDPRVWRRYQLSHKIPFEYKGTEKNDEADEIRSATGVWRLGKDDKRLVCADNPNVEIYEK